MKIFLLPVITILILTGSSESDDSISYNTVKTWANKLTSELSLLENYLMDVDEFHKSYKQAEVKPRNGNALVQEIAKDIKSMMESKISAIKRIMDVAETSALSAPDVDPPNDYYYVNAKNNSIELINSAHFGGSVNLNMSAVHVPTNVYDRAQNVIRAIKWSEELDKTFINNYEQDPSLSWQYFGSATGFMRQYPAMTWSTNPVDLFDCRTRSWYIEAASSPKDVLILVDSSGSMTGIRKEIARHVVNNILDTLGNNDFVNIITFSDETREVVPCFNDTLVQANLANVRDLKDSIADMTTDKIANFSAALYRAFELLDSFRQRGEGSLCNQAIMLITDGVPYNYKEIFQKYNWKGNLQDPDKADMPVRVFTYLIGREVADVREVKWMACANRGYYVHLSTLAEVREQVLNYVPVMARPLVLGRTNHPTIWTPVYADVTDPKMSDWYWEQTQCDTQRERFQGSRKNIPMEILDRMIAQKQKLKQKKIRNLRGILQDFRLMTTVSMPVFDRRENATRIADLLGVAGTDVPVEEIQKLMMPHMLGVNGYAFIVTNNGYVLIHPDLRPVFQDILKPAYNSVDMAEVELMDLSRGPREFEEGILMFREGVINQTTSTVTLHTRYHYDDMMRVGRVRRKYDYTGIDNTPFTVVVSLPEHDHIGNYRVHATEEIHRSHVKGKDVTDYFAGGNWRVHPDWMYCKYHYESEHKFDSSEKQLLHFLERTRQPGWKWTDSKQRSQPPEYSALNSGHSQTHQNPVKADRNSYYCDRNLLLSLVFDAKVTEWFANTNVTRKKTGEEFQRFRFTLAFVATHSGLTRWQDFSLDDGPLQDDHFSKLHPRTIDEVWYKRAVEQHYVQPGSFVFSIPIDKEGANNSTLVTASIAIFIDNGRAKAPAAVVGFQFHHSALQDLLRNITYNCPEMGNCQKHCGDESLACYLIDNNGYILAAEDAVEAGRFLGDVRGPIMSSLVDDGIYDKIRIFDYQAVCFRKTQTSNHGSSLFMPWKSIQRTFAWLVSQAAWTWAKVGFWESDYVYAYSNENEEEEDEHEDYQENNEEPAMETKDEKSYDQNVPISRTKPQPCDQEVYLYLLRNVSSRIYDTDFDSSKGCDRPYVIQPVNLSNMLLLVINTMCPNTDKPTLSIVPEEVIYSNNSLACQKVMNGLKRRRPSSCIRNHPKESEIKNLCGSATRLGPSLFLLFLLICSLTRLIRD